jgi:hypothetical protein
MDPNRTHWNREQNRIIVEVYFEMLRKEQIREPYIKAQYNRIVQEKTGRSKGSVEFKLCNISFLLQEIDHPIITGYKPRSNAQRGSLSDVLAEYLDTTKGPSSLCIGEPGKILKHGVPRIDFVDAAVFTLQRAFPIDGWHIDTLKTRFDERYPKFRMTYPDRSMRTILIESLRSDDRVAEIANLVFVPFVRFRRTEDGEEEARLMVRYGYDEDNEPPFEGMDIGISVPVSLVSQERSKGKTNIQVVHEGQGVVRGTITRANMNKRLLLIPKTIAESLSRVPGRLKSLFGKNLPD